MNLEFKLLEYLFNPKFAEIQRYSRNLSHLIIEEPFLSRLLYVVGVFNFVAELSYPKFFSSRERYDIIFGQAYEPKFI